MSSKLLLKFIISLLFLFCLESSYAGTVNLKAEYEKTVKYYQVLLKENPGDYDLRIRLSKFYYSFRDYEPIKKLLKNQKHFQARVILAKAYACLKEYGYAIEIFDRLDKDFPDNIEGFSDGEYFYLYATALESKNLFSKAIKTYKKVAGKLRENALSRIKEIKSRTEQKIPKQILEISRKAKNFIEKESDAAAVILFVNEDIELTPRNTSVSTVHVIEQILKERGKRLAEVEIGYDSTYERIELELARSITKDGKVMYAGKEHIRDVSKYLNFPLYSNARAMIISMPMVDVGSFIEYKIKIYSSKLINEKDISFVYRLRERYPVYLAKFKLSIPKEDKAHFKFFNTVYAGSHDLKPRFKKKADSKIYSWEFKEIKPLIPEYNMPPQARVNPAVAISSFSSWEEIYLWWSSLYSDKFTLSEQTKEFTKELTKDCKNYLDKAKKLYEFCARNIRYVAVEYGESGHEPHAGEEVFVNRYGDCKDQAILLVAMMRFSGIRAYPVLIPTRSIYEISEEFPSVNFNHAICALENEGELIFMDPTAETTSFGDLPLSDQNRTVMVFLDKQWKITKTPMLSENGVSYEMVITLDAKENASITRIVTTQGFFTSGHRWYLKYTHPFKIKEDIQEKMVQISSFSKLMDYEIKNVDDFDRAPVLKYVFTTEKFLNPAGKLRIVPALDEMQLDNNLIAKEQRRFAVDFGALFSKRSKLRVILPDNLEIKHMPEPAVLDSPWFTFSAAYKKERNELIRLREFKIKSRFVETNEYEKFKNQLEKVLYLLREEVILEKVENK